MPRLAELLEFYTLAWEHTLRVLDSKFDHCSGDMPFLGRFGIILPS